MSKSTTLSAQIAALMATVADQQARIDAMLASAQTPSTTTVKPSDFRIVIVRDIKPKRDGARRYSQIEVYDNTTGKRIVDALIDTERDFGRRKGDEGDQTVIYASRRKTPASVTTPTASAQAENPF